MAERKKIGIALSGGGVRGIAHIAVLEVLEDLKIPIDYISGTSMGAIVAALYAFEPNAKKLKKEILKIDISKLFDFTISKYGFIKGNRLEEFFQKRFNNMTFKDAKIPLFITAYDIERNREVIFNKGDVSRAIRSSISIPGIFFPVQNKNEILVDGGVIDPIPSEILKKQGADVIIVSNVQHYRTNTIKLEKATKIRSKNKKMPSAFGVALKSLQVLDGQIAMFDLIRGPADLVINVNLENIGTFDSNKTKEILNKGRNAALSKVEEIRAAAENNPLKILLSELNADLGIKKIYKKIKSKLK